MGTIRYIAVIARDADALARFYSEEVGLEELGRSPEGDVSLTDGFYNLTLFRQRDGLMELRRDSGIHHLGVAVDSIDEVLEKYRALVPGGVAVQEPGGIHYGEIRIFDPECNPVSLSESGFGLGEGRHGLPRIGHVAIHTLQPQRSADFFTSLFGLRELRTTEERRRQGRFNCFLGDGHSNLALHPYYRTRDRNGFATYDRIGHDGGEESPAERRFGLHHFGMLMRDASQKAAQLSQGRTLVADRPEVRPYAEFRVVDPEGNGFDLTQNKGWEVDVDRWERVA